MDIGSCTYVLAYLRCCLNIDAPTPPTHTPRAVRAAKPRKLGKTVLNCLRYQPSPLSSFASSSSPPLPSSLPPPPLCQSLPPPPSLSPSPQCQQPLQSPPTPPQNNTGHRGTQGSGSSQTRTSPCSRHRSPPPLWLKKLFPTPRPPSPPPWPPPTTLPLDKQSKPARTTATSNLPTPLASPPASRHPSFPHRT